MVCLNKVKNNLKDSAAKFGMGSNFTFQRDNYPKTYSIHRKIMASVSLPKSA